MLMQVAAGHDQDSFDKQVLRNWLTEHGLVSITTTVALVILPVHELTLERRKGSQTSRCLPKSWKRREAGTSKSTNV